MTKITPTPREERKGIHWQELNEIIDPEVGIGIVDLGLIYTVDIDKDGKAEVNMSLTSPMCPVGPMLIDQVKFCMQSQENIKNVDVHVVWDPPWTQDLIDPDLKAMMFGA